MSAADKIKNCYDCVHCQTHMHEYTGKLTALCDCVECRNRVVDWPVPCKIARSLLGNCKIQAIHFNPKKELVV